MSSKTASIVIALALSAAGCAIRPPAPDAALRDAADAAYTAEDPAARPLYQRLAASEQAQPEDWYRLGNTHAWSGELEAAAAAYREALAQDSELAQARHNLGMTYLQLGVNAILEARRELPDVDPAAAGTMRWLACTMEIFMGYPDPTTCREPADKE